MKRLESGRLVVVLVACGAVLCGVAFLLLHLIAPYDNARLAPGQAVWQPDGIIVTPLQEYPGGLQRGDRVVAVDGVSMEAWARSLFLLGAPRLYWEPGQTVTYTVIRSGEHVDVSIRLGSYPLEAILAEEWGPILFALIFLAIATAVFLLRPDDHGARIQLLIAASITGATTWSLGLQISDIINGAGFWLFSATTVGIYLLFWISILHFILVFPQKHFIIIKRRWIVPLIYVAPYLFCFVQFTWVWYQSSSALALFGCCIPANGVVPSVYLALTLVALILTYRAGDTAARQKLRWLIYAAILSGGGGILVWQIPNFLLGHSLISPNALGLLVLPYPLALAIAILRYRLFDIDLIINRTLVYGTLTASIIGVYVLVVGGLGTLLHMDGNLFISLLATGLVAVIFQPLRVSLQRMVNRLVYGERDEPYRVLSRLGHRLEVTLAPEAMLPTIVETVAQALKLPYAAIALKQGDEFVTAASYGLPPGELLTLPLLYHAQPVGCLLLAPRAPSEEFSHTDRRLLEDIASQAGIAAHAVRLTADLQHSRERLVTAREEERRRLRRDLHDGLGPTLASMTLKLDAARNLLAQNSPAVDPMLSELKVQLQITIADIRRLVYDLRPPALDELGLVSALREQSVHYSQLDGVHIQVEAPLSLPVLPAAVEVAVYRIVLEALTNMTRHAQARTCSVCLSLDKARGAGTELIVEVIDDGRGFPLPVHAGIGMSSMRERAAELGGTCVIESRVTEGTRVLVRLPLGEE